MIEERRKYIRLNTSLDFSYKIKDASMPEKKASTKNVSPGGIQGYLDKKIKKGDQLELTLYIPIFKKPISAVGKVVWTAGESAGKIDAGIKFEEVSLEMKNKFLEFICELMFAELEKMK